jgi:hypothetical protein
VSAELLRRAAAKMRERATHPDLSGSPWFASPHGDVHDDGSLWVCDSQSGEAAEHIASWHPDVALAVADWLDAEAGSVEFDGGRPDLLSVQSLAVARAFLGAES